MTAPTPFEELLRLPVGNADDVTSLRHVAARAASLLHLESVDVTRIATSVSELGRLVQGQGLHSVIFGADNDAVRPSLLITFDFADRLVPAGLGPTDPTFIAVSRLMDGVDIRATGITVRKNLPGPVAPELAVQIRTELSTGAAVDPRVVLHRQNEELVATLAALRDRETDLVRLNDELEQTNRGVVALYAELERRAAEVRTAQRHVFSELERALRPPPPPIAGIEVAIEYLPAQQNSPTGGDLYDWFLLPDGSLQVTVVDVQGHGVTGTRDALWVTHAVRALTLEGHELGELLARVDSLAPDPDRKATATSLIARCDPVTGILSLAGAGHPPALHVRHGGPAEYLPADGRPLGYPRPGSVGVTQQQLEPGDVVVLYTDGLVEIRRDIAEGMQTLLGAAEQVPLRPLPQFLADLVRTCKGRDDLRDDTLLLALRWLPVR